jgi:hypothetical protein
MTFDEMVGKVLNIFPNALFDEVSETGEITISTGVRVDDLLCVPLEEM